MSSCRSHGKARRIALIALFLIAALTACAAGQVKDPPVNSTQQSDNASNDQPAAVAQGVVVPDLDRAIYYIIQARDNTYWFGSNKRGVYRYDGKSLVNFTTKDGLVSNQIRGIQEDKAGNIYLTTYEGTSRFDGRAFTTLDVSPSSDWMKQPDDLWFVGAQDTGVVYRYDGNSLHRLALPRTTIGEEQAARFSRSKFPNAIFSPYDVYTIAKDRKGNIWFGTAAAGACRFDGHSFTWLYETHLSETQEGGSFGVRSILEDKAGAFWICNTRFRYRLDPNNAAEPEKGLMKYKREKGIERLKAPDGQDHVYFMAIVEDEKGDLWMASGGDGVWQYDGDTVTHYPVKDGAKDVWVFSICIDNGGNLWLGTHEAGAYKFNGRTFEKFRP